MEKYVLEDCSMYIHKQIKNKDIYIFEEHNMAIPIWGTYSSRSQTEFNLITFDFHTDTRSPFWTEVSKEGLDYQDNIVNELEHPVVKNILYGKCYNKNDFDFKDVWKIALEDVKNDEHIKTAYRFGYIKSYNIICDCLDVSGANAYERDDRDFGYVAKYYIRSQQSEINFNDIELPIILDFDLDYFIQENCFNEEFKKAIKPLVKKAALITIAKESIYFEHCKTQKEYTVEKALAQLLTIIEELL